jgi:uncharacterized protein (UPF0248 family)
LTNCCEDLNRRLPNIHARIWPARFVDRDVSEEDTDYQGYYLIGLDGQKINKDDERAALGSLQSALHRFESQIRGDEKYFDDKYCWMSASLVKQADVESMRLDGREWGEHKIGDDEEDDEEEEEEEEEDPDEADDLSDGGAGTNRPSARRRRKQAVDMPVRPAYEGKFRPAADVMNRLRWDPEMDGGDFLVGYEDRFLGAKERALDLWKTEQTDEEFIPQHRILYFKRKSDDVVVWDRAGRRDDVFGSGVSSNNQT